MRRLLAILGRDLSLAGRFGSESATVIAFFVIAVAMFPFGVGPEPQILARIGAGVIWVTALLAALLSLDRMFQSDFEDGNLDQIALSGVPFEAVVLTKCLAHWLTTGLPLIVVSPLLALLLGLDPSAYPTLILAMALGTPTLSLLGGIGAALTLGARRGGVLIPVLVLPLVVPVLIFGVAAVDAAVAGLASKPHILILAGLELMALALAPWAGGAALRQALD